MVEKIQDVLSVIMFLTWFFGSICLFNLGHDVLGLIVLFGLGGFQLIPCLISIRKEEDEYDQ